MKNIVSCAFLLAVSLLFLSSCKDKPGDGIVTLHSDSQITLQAAETDTTFSFTATDTWTIQKENGAWLTIDPERGAAGEITATLTAEANDGTDARSATVRILCGNSEATVAVTQEGKDATAVPAEELIKKISIEDHSDGSRLTYTFSYDGNSRVSRIEFIDAATYSGDEDIRMSYDIEYGDGTVLVSGTDGEYTSTLRAELDENGRTVETEYTEMKDPYGTGELQEYRATNTLEYDSEGRLVKETGRKYGYQDYQVTYTWENGNLTEYSYSSSYYNVEFTYSEHGNTGNIDINWILSGGYGGNGYAGFFGILDLLGQRSSNYVWPDVWDYMAEADPTIGVDGPIHKDLIGTTVEHEYTRTVSGTPEVEYSFDGNLLTKIVKTTPREEVTYTQTYEYHLEAPNITPNEEGYYEYGVILIPVGEKIETGSQPTTPIIETITIQY